jgi:hypothetical protein
MGSKQHVKWSFLLAWGNPMFDAFNGQVLVNFFQQNFQDVILEHRRAVYNIKKWWGGDLKKSQFSTGPPYIGIDYMPLE